MRKEGEVEELWEIRRKERKRKTETRGKIRFQFTIIDNK